MDRLAAPLLRQSNNGANGNGETSKLSPEVKAAILAAFK
jgi:hypothetical protein